MNMFYFW